MSDKKPVPPALAEFALEQLAEAGEQAAIDLTVQNVEILRAEIVKLDARIEDLEAQVEDTESRRENSARNSSAFEDRMGDLQVENGKLQARIAELEAAAAQKDERISIFESNLPAWGSLRLELAALKAQQPSAGGVDERAAFDAWFTDHTKDWPFPSESIKSIARSNDWLVWQARARLNPCRAQSVPADHSAQTLNMVSMKAALEAIYDSDYQAPHDATDAEISMSKKLCIFRMRKLAKAALECAAAPSAQQKESGDE